ncbi:MAG TPA: 7-cyano-7-deazaguanine synthase [Conexivisphaerales archaeon]|nr:7-cyano-7-deazaguanine synthase [Conexivisphaerales archaeon]
MSGVQGRKPKAMVLLSGGLDSTLALAMMKEMGVDVIAVSFKTPFCNFDCGSGACGGKIGDTTLKYGVEWKPVSLGTEYLDIVRKPRHGHGSALNPCVDCRVMMYGRAKAMMKELGADFIVTGEVVGQRPMSQNRQALDIIERESGLQGLILRPLCAQLMEPTIPEKEGWVDRSRLLSVEGRSRRVQIQMAKSIGWKEYPNPSGGCLLTEKGFARRLKDLFEHEQHPDQNDIDLLKVGRHLRLEQGAKLVVGRDVLENSEISALAREDDVLMEVEKIPGPMGLLRGRFGEPQVVVAASVVARYSDAPRDVEAKVSCRLKSAAASSVSVMPMAAAEVAKLIL